MTYVAKITELEVSLTKGAHSDDVYPKPIIPFDQPVIVVKNQLT